MGLSRGDASRLANCAVLALNGIEMQKLKLETDLFVITKLHEICNGRKRNIQIDKDVLSKLLIDHANMYDVLMTISMNDTDIEISTPNKDKLFLDGRNEKGKRVAGRTRVRIIETKAETNFKRRRVRL